MQPLPQREFDFSGRTYTPSEDKARLNKQQQAVFDVMSDGKWHTLAEIAQATHCPESSVSARLRDLRKEQFGAYPVERRLVHRGLYEYCVLSKIQTQ